MTACSLHALRAGPRRRVAFAIVAVLAALGAVVDARAALEVALIAGDEPPEFDAPASLGRLRVALERDAAGHATVVTAARGSGRMPALAVLREADAAVIYGGSGILAPEDAALLRHFLARGKGLLVLRASVERWTEWPDFGSQILGAKPQGMFAKGAPMRVINLFGHAVFTGVHRLETEQPMPFYADLAADALLVMEGTVGEATTPLGWLRSRGPGRIAHVVPASRELFAQPDYVRLLVNVLRWIAHQPIPGARALVQRTYLADAYPGAITVTFPEGPTLGFDPTRGGVSQVADGDFVDLRPRWLTKQGEPAKMAGTLFFHDDGRGSFWAGASGGESKFQFQGYSVKEAFPEFFYRIGDREIREQLRPVAGGAGLIRELHVSAGAEPLLYRQQSQPAAGIVVSGGAGAANPDGFQIAAGQSAVVRIEIRPKRGGSR